MRRTISRPAGDTGALGERAAAAYFRRKGYRIVGANVRCRFGEIDLIVSDEVYLVFAEVKTRSPGSLSFPREAVDARKQERIIKTALLYLSRHPTALQPRFDVVEVTAGDGTDFSHWKINHLPDAFSAPPF